MVAAVLLLLLLFISLQDKTRAPLFSGSAVTAMTVGELRETKDRCLPQQCPRSGAVVDVRLHVCDPSEAVLHVGRLEEEEGGRLFRIGGRAGDHERDLLSRLLLRQRYSTAGEVDRLVLELIGCPIFRFLCLLPRCLLLLGSLFLPAREESLLLLHHRRKICHNCTLLEHNPPLGILHATPADRTKVALKKVLPLLETLEELPLAAEHVHLLRDRPEELLSESSLRSARPSLRNRRVSSRAVAGRRRTPSHTAELLHRGREVLRSTPRALCFLQFDSIAENPVPKLCFDRPLLFSRLLGLRERHLHRNTLAEAPVLCVLLAELRCCLLDARGRTRRFLRLLEHIPPSKAARRRRKGHTAARGIV
mmetsp:Transcript_21868/g.85700  ORF Transcript_21868/g.85700 Transcript_21868/m.85700 type:complete len:364 (+) Transcript_21868:1291-2382(+)